MIVRMARTNIDLDEVLVQRVMVRYHLSTKREAVDYALRHLAGEPLTRMQAAEMLGSIPDFSVPTESGPPAWGANHDSD
jgi:Arc/MetJ family transcription regulator